MDEIEANYDLEESRRILLGEDDPDMEEEEQVLLVFFCIQSS